MWHLAGAGITTERAMVERVERELGRPVKTMVVGKTLLRLFNPVMREFVEMHYLMTSPVILDDSALYALLGPIRKTSYDEGVHAVLAVLASQGSGPGRSAAGAALLAEAN